MPRKSTVWWQLMYVIHHHVRPNQDKLDLTLTRLRYLLRTVVALSPLSPESYIVTERRHVSGPNTPAPLVGPGLYGCTS